jgi:hypothetical protein
MSWLLSNKADTHVHIFTSNESKLRKEMKVKSCFVYHPLNPTFRVATSH